MTLSERLHALGVVPVVVIDDPRRAVPLARALVAAGLPCMEVTLRTPAALAAIASIAESVPEVLLGAGSVLHAEQVDRAVDAGAAFIVSPGTDSDVVARAREREVEPIPGIATATEVQRALRAGVKTLKFFPAGGRAGLGALRSLAAVFDEVRFMPTGGIGAAELPVYIREPGVVAVGGSWMVSRRTIDAGDFATIRRLTEAAVAAVGHARPAGAAPP
ncbi:MAG TPA: bifunctional 4-hydroxy-2-oxoglutarate aldolase/2-dehydro-3-deoxy-phosphogluconate aldolase [Solirubrobacter sp.]